MCTFKIEKKRRKEKFVSLEYYRKIVSKNERKVLWDVDEPD